MTELKLTHASAIAALTLLLGATMVPAPDARADGVCDDPVRQCSGRVSPACLTRSGAGSLPSHPAGVDGIAADDAACAEQFDAYRVCLMDVALKCGAPAPEATAAAPAEPTPGRPVEYTVIDRDYASDDYTEKLLATIDGFQYLIHTFETNIEIVFSQDFDGNGYQDALISEHLGGASDPFFSYIFILYMGEGHFLRLPIEEFQAHRRPELVIRDDRWMVEFRYHETPGVSAETIAVYTIEKRRPAVYEKSERRPLLALKEIRNTDFDRDADDGAQTRAFSHDFDGDGVEDQFVCGYWWRWNSLSGCKMIQAGSGRAFEIEFEYDEDARAQCGFSRFGVLPTRINGYAALVCDEDFVFAVDPAKGAFVARER